MSVVKTIEEVTYNKKYWWDSSINRYATIENGLGNCTCFVYGAVLEAGLPQIVDKGVSARYFHEHLINGWVAKPYSSYKANIKVGDVIEWVDGNHVAIVSKIENGKVWISGSFYTGIHGKSMYNGSYDTRDGINSLKELNDFMVKNYPYRFFHHVPLSDENSWCGGEPTYVLVAPASILPVDKNTSVNQVYVGTTGLRVRTEPNTSSLVRGTADVGYYNVQEVINGEDYVWYKVNDLYIAGVEGVVYYPAEDTPITPIEEIVKLIEQMQEAYLLLEKEKDYYKAKVEQIRGIVNE